MTENISIETLRAYCSSYINYTPFDVAILELHRQLNTEKPDIEQMKTIDYIKDWERRQKEQTNEK